MNHRKYEVLTLLRAGLSLREISERLNISYGYVRRLVCELRKQGLVGYLRRGRPSKRAPSERASRLRKEVTFSEGSRKFHQKRYLPILTNVPTSEIHENVTSAVQPDNNSSNSSLHLISILSNRELKILRLLFLKGRRLDNTMTVKELSRLSGIPRNSLYRILRRLVSLGLVNRVGWGLYALNELAILLLLGNVFARCNLVSRKNVTSSAQLHDYLVSSVRGHQLKYSGRYLPLPPLEWAPGSLFLHGGMFLVEFSKGRELYNRLVSCGRFKVVRLRNGVKYVLVRLDKSGLRITLEVFNNGTVKLHVRGDPIHQFEVRELGSWVLEFIREYVPCRRLRLVLRDFELSRIILDNSLIKAWKALGLKYYKVYVHGNHIREEWRFSGYSIAITGQFTLQDVLEHIRLRVLNLAKVLKGVSRG